MKFLIPLLLVCSLSWGAERQNINVDENWTPKDSKYFMCNFFSDTPKTILSNVKDITFEMCNFYGCEPGGTYTLKRSNIVDTTPKVVLTLQQLKARKIELENQMVTDSKEIPKEYYEEWINILEGVVDEETIINP